MARPPNSLESTDEPSWRATAARWLAVLGVVAAVEIVVVALPPPPAPIEVGARLYPPSRPPTLDESLIQWQLDRVLRTHADIVLLGDSSALNGLDPAAFARVTGLTAQNFSTVRWLSTDGHADTLELYVWRHGPPRIVVYQMGTGLHGIGMPAMRRSSSARGELLRATREWLGARDDAPGPPLPSLAWRPFARVAVEGTRYAPIYTGRAITGGVSDDDTRRWLEEHDGMSVDRNPRPIDAWDPTQAPPVGYDPDIETGLVRMFELARREGFLVLVVHNPIPDLYRDDARTAAYEHVERRLVAVAAPYPNVRVLSPFARYAPTSAFANFEHLSPEGARHNSLQIAQMVAAALGVEPTPRVADPHAADEGDAQPRTADPEASAP